jgi:polysaccharide pyruvyl transferase WcaK-like protein
MVQSKETQQGITVANYRELITGILQNTTDDIALIPHVVWSHNDDRKPLRELYEMFRDTGRVYLVEDQNCMQLKEIISRCRIFVGARTHATIAAYSTCVPTLVVGYSVKARGIAKDLFGTEKNYVLPVQSLQETGDLLKAYFWIAERESEIRNHLQNSMPDYIARAKAAGEVLLGEK